MRHLTAALGAAFLLLPTAFTEAHGFVGDRFFPPTITTDDPFATDELALPTISIFENPAGDGGPETLEVDSGFEFDKEILPHLSLGISDVFIWQKPEGDPSVRGWDNMELTLKYQLYQNEKYEFIISAGLTATLGGTGSLSVGRDSFTTFTPTFYFGKGFGDLPDSLAGFQPFAITGTLGQTIPTSAAPSALQWGLALEYSLPYLQQHVRDIGLPAPFKNMIPLVEFSMTSAENRGTSGTTGTVDPGILWEFKYCQLGVEALIPVNAESGRHVGAVVQLQIFIDDLFPKVFGHPLF